MTKRSHLVSAQSAGMSCSGGSSEVRALRGVETQGHAGHVSP